MSVTMSYAIEVNGNRVHDEGEHEPGHEKRVKRVGGGTLTFETQAEAASDSSTYHYVVQ